ncbi:MAG: ABC transporter substrate-binding protein [Deltaproteobacteria bacterium]|nr:ABC transporter substrate-binding protein [Deltaproteobacteria bacterium]MBW2025347.1 ABC transporter substrate-binding protein [Deltaproteobacteria bacterium]MBW2125214.1 ABC transporter substrate-binding protein [Deltaproteobacteria bacterium]
MKRLFGKALLIFGVWALWVLPIFSSSEAGEVLKIGLITGLTGGTASWGKQVQDMAQLIGEEIKEAGGFKVGGKRVRVDFKIYDSESNPTVAATQTEKAITEGCKIIMAGPQSAVDFTASEHCERAGVIYVNAYNVLDKLAERGYEYYFRTCGDISVYVKEAMKYFLWQEKRTGVKAKKVAIFTNENVVCSFAGEKYFELIPKMAPHWDIVGNKVATYPKDVKDFTLWLSRYKSEGVDLFLAIRYPSDAILFARQLRQMDYNPLALHGVLGGEYDPEYGQTLKWQCLYVTDTAYFSPMLKLPGLDEFNKKYKARYGTDIPNNAANLACAITVIKDAVERAGSLDEKSLLSALRSTDIRRLGYEKGKWWFIIPEGCKFNKKGENIRIRGVTTMWVDPETQVPVFPSEFATEVAPWPRPSWKQLEKEFGQKYPLK